jgi:NAD(P)-dependent dehydrogenase (short-subunit alcohol dehydrogenase family)
MVEPDKVCVVAGVGPGNGAALSRRFAAGGYRVAMLARSADRLEGLASEIAAARSYPVDLTDRAAVESTFAAIRAQLGPVDVLVHNAAAGAREEFLDLAPETLERTFKVNVLSLLHCGQLAARDMLERGRGAIVVTGNTAARRGMPAFAGFAPTKAAQRILAESMARSLGPKGIHVAYVVIDAVIDLPWTRKRMPQAPDEFFAQPTAIAETVWHLAHQDRSAWSFEVDLRPFGEKW